MLAFCILPLAVACKSDAETICEKSEDCGTLRQSVEECVARIEDLVEDKAVSDDEVSECAECFSDNSCGELSGGDCVAICYGPFFD